MFTSSLLNDPEVKLPPDKARSRLAAASVDLGETDIPESLAPSEKANVDVAIANSYIGSLNMLL